MGVWDTTTPDGSALVSEGDDRIREMKSAVQEALQANDTTLGNAGSFPGPSPSTAPLFHYRGLKGTTAQRPASGNYGLYYNTTTGTLQRDNGTTWEDVGTLFSANIGISTPVANKAYLDLLPKAWAYTNSSGTLQAGVNLTVTRTGTGLFVYTFRTNMANANYAVVGTAETGVTCVFIDNRSSSGFRLRTTLISTLSAFDQAHFVIVMGTQ